ncbi:Uncharacterized protein Fot_18646 [Forsythia ovata]|uniref:40S ribosomal protein S29 n=1 Tax=Forsythia ovata TaxID=205694 RepID=A0ABD1VIS9_9LAMI
MGHSNIWNSHPKTYGPGSRTCRVCGNPHGIIRKYGIMCCRQCFRSNAKEIGFIKLYTYRNTAPVRQKIQKLPHCGIRSRSRVLSRTGRAPAARFEGIHIQRSRSFMSKYNS